MKKIKILYILNVASRVNNFSYTSMIAAQNLNFEYHIAGNWNYEESKEKERDENKYGIKIHQVDFFRSPYHPKNMVAYRQLKKIIQDGEFNLIHCNTPIGGVLGRIIGKKFKISPVIYQAHGFHFYKGAPKLNWLIYYPIEKWLARYTDFLITINKEDFELSKTFRLREQGECRYVSGVGIDTTEFFDVKLLKDEKRKEIGIPNDSVVLISVGELNENKNHKVIISALGKLKDPNFCYILCGEGNKKRELEEISDKLGIRKNIFFLGYRKDIKELYAVSDIYVMPSYREGLSRSIMEAMAMGLPCVVSNIRGNRDLVIEREQGFLCGSDDINGFSDIISLLGRNQELRVKMKLAAIERIKKFDNTIVIKKYESIYKEALMKVKEN